MFTNSSSPSCSIFLVVNGHFHNGDLSEARRTDTNSCGGTVTRSCPTTRTGPTAVTATCATTPSCPREPDPAFTYSPYLGQFETDADSQFRSRTT